MSSLKAFDGSPLKSFQGSALKAFGPPPQGGDELLFDSSAQMYIDRHPTTGALDDDDMSGFVVNP